MCVSEHAFNAYRLDQFIISRFQAVILPYPRNVPNLLAISSTTEAATLSRSTWCSGIVSRLTFGLSLNLYLYFPFIAIILRHYRYLLAYRRQHALPQHSRRGLCSRAPRCHTVIDKMLKAPVWGLEVWDGGDVCVCVCVFICVYVRGRIGKGTHEIPW